MQCDNQITNILKWGQHYKYCSKVMKTQISNLINGSKEIRRSLTHSKYINAAQATSHTGYAGSERKVRQEIADKVIAENLNGLDVEMFGKTIHLERNSSLSGKTVYFSTKLNLADFRLISGYTENPFSKYEGSFTLIFNNDMTVELQMFSRRNSNSQWKHRGSLYVDEAFVTIL